MPMPSKDIAGKKFGMLTAIGIVGKRGKANLWKCLCDCGSETTSIATSLERGEKTSCGCKKTHKRKPRPDLAERNKLSSTHGMTNTTTFSSWKAMRFRCENPASKDYPNYGGRGIKVCEAWSKSFEAFLADMGERPDGTSLDRIDVNGNYEPSNTRWATQERQSNNKRQNMYVEFNGEVKTATEWARLYGIESKTFIYRLKNGWTVDVALTKKSARSK